MVSSVPVGQSVFSGVLISSEQTDWKVWVRLSCCLSHNSIIISNKLSMLHSRTAEKLWENNKSPVFSHIFGHIFNVSPFFDVINKPLKGLLFCGKEFIFTLRNVHDLQCGWDLLLVSCCGIKKVTWMTQKCRNLFHFLASSCSNHLNSKSSSNSLQLTFCLHCAPKLQKFAKAVFFCQYFCFNLLRHF